MDFLRPSGMVQTLETYRGEIFQLYIVFDKTASDVIAILKQIHNFDATPKALKTKLSQWGFTKNVKRCEVVQALQEKARRQSAGNWNDYVFTVRQRPMNLEQVERHRLRAGLPDFQQQYHPDRTQNIITDIACWVPSPSPPTSPPEHWRISEKLLYDIDILIKGSFEAGVWSFRGNDLMIKSSNSQDVEIKVLHDFLEHFAIGCHAANAQKFDQAGICWQRAFANVEALVRGNYHDIIPHLIQKINDLNNQGRTELAELLKNHIALCGTWLLGPNAPTTSIFYGLGKLDMAFMLEIEERIMKHFTKLFDMYLGHLCYGSFVMMMDGARRRLLQYPWATFDCLPDISYLDSVFGPVNRRSLDVIGIRIEVLSHRGMYIEAEMEAAILVQRAKMIQSNDWQRFYNLTRGWYFLGSAQYFLRKRDAAIQCLYNALRSDDELCKIDEFHIFNAERTMILKYIEHLRSVNWIVEEGEGCGRGPNSSVGPLVFFRCCKEPTRHNNLSRVDLSSLV